MAEPLPTTTDLFGAPEAPQGALPTTDELFGGEEKKIEGRLFPPSVVPLNSQEYEKSIYPTIGRIMKHSADAAVETYNSPDSALFTQEHRKEAMEAGIPRPLFDPAAMIYDTVMRPMTAAFAGAETALQETGELHSPALGRDLALLPQAFPFGIKNSMGIPHPEAVANYVARVPESVYMGTREATPEQRAFATDAANAIPKPETVIPETPLPDIHAVARTIAPETFARYDALDEVKQGLRNDIKQRSEALQAESPYNAQIAELQKKMESANPRKSKIYQDKIDVLSDQHDDWLAESLAKDAELIRMRNQLQKADYQMRDLATDVSAAYREAESHVTPSSKAEDGVAAPEASAEESKPVEAPPEAPKPLERTPEEQRLVDMQHSAIASDVAAKLQAAGRGAEEAQAAAQLVAAHYQAIADMGWTKGLPIEIYKREGPNIVAGKEVERARTFAQDGTTLNQKSRGKIKLATDKAKATISLFKSSNASTFIHETGHAWLEEMFKYGREADAPKSLTDSIAAVRKYLNIGDEEIIPRKAHEKFARSFERYMMEGVAPSREMVTVFEKFKKWLTDIYKVVDRLRAPITDDIRDVFDRLLSATPEKIVVAADREPGKMAADIHEADARHTPDEQAISVRDRINEEVNKTAKLHEPEVADELGKIGRVKEEAGSDGAPAPKGSGQPAAQEPEALAKGGSDTGAKSGGLRKPEKPIEASPAGEQPGTPHAPFAKTKEDLVDKAGNIRLDKLNAPDDIDTVLRDSAERNNGFVDDRRVGLSATETVELAEAMGVDPAWLQTKKVGEAFSPHEIVAAKKLLIQSAASVREAMQKAASGNKSDILGLAEAITRHDMIQAKVAQATAEWSHAGRALQVVLDGGKEAADISEFLKKNTGRTLNQLEDMARLGAKLDDPAKMAKFLQDSKKASFTDMILEFWTNAILSGPQTHVTNMLSNMLVSVNSAAETAIAAGVGKILKSEDAVLAGEAKAKLFGIFQGAKDGIIAAAHAYKNEASEIGALKIEAARTKAIPGIAGRIIRTPGDLLVAEDELSKSIAVRQELNALAYRAAKGDPAGMARILANPTDEMMQQAKKAADYQTFTKALGPTGAAVQRFANSHPLLKFIIPFIRTPTNIVKYAGERTPFGLLSAEIRANLAGENGTIARDTQIARMAMGTTIGIATLGMALNGSITGGGPGDPKKKAMLYQTGWQPYSVKIGNTYYSYARMEPLGTLMGVSADLAEISEASEKDKIVSMVMASITKNLTNKTFLQGISNLIEAVNDPERYGDSYINKFAASFVPNILAQTAQTIDPVMRDARTLTDQVKSRIPGLSQTLLPKRDIWGEPISRGTGAGPDILSPIYTSEIKSDPVAKRLLDLGVFPAKLDRKINGVQLTDQQYDEYSRIAGKMTKLMLTNLMQPGFEFAPPGIQEKLVRNTIDNARETARNMVKFNPANANIMRDAIAAKQAIVKPMATKP